MGRQLFLHHYLPAHLASALVTGALLEFIFNVEPVLDDATMKANKKIAGLRKHLPARQKLAGQNLLASWAASGSYHGRCHWRVVLLPAIDIRLPWPHGSTSQC